MKPKPIRLEVTIRPGADTRWSQSDDKICLVIERGIRATVAGSTSGPIPDVRVKPRKQ